MKPDTLMVRRAPAPPGAPYRDALIPADDKTAELVAAMALGATVTLKLKRERSTPQHRLFWSILSHVAEASEWETAERLLVALKIRLGRYDLLKLPNGKVVPVPQSISFAAMGQDDFQKFMDDAVRVICEEVLPGMDSTRLIAEVQSMIGSSRDALERERAA